MQCVWVHETGLVLETRGDYMEAEALQIFKPTLTLFISSQLELSQYHQVSIVW